MNPKLDPRHVAKAVYWRTRNLAGAARAKVAISPNIGATPRRAMTNAFFKAWPRTYSVISRVNRLVPTSGPIRRTFENAVFTRHWNRWYKLAYVPEHRDRFFEHIVTFFYRYPICQGDIVVEVGASSGEEASRFARAVGRRGRLIAVEPEPGNVTKLRAALPADTFPQVTIVAKGAWKHSGELKFFVGGEKEHRLADLSATELTYEWWGVTDHLHAKRYKGETTVPVDTVDNIVAEAGIDRIDFILFETNGAELEGVQGMVSSLAITKRIAARGHVIRDGVPIYKAIEAHLQSKGFETAVTSEGMVLAQRPEGWRMPLMATGKPS